MPDYRWEPLGGGIELAVNGRHTFGTDALLLAEFAAPKRRERCVDLCSGCGIIPFLWMRSPNAPESVKLWDIQPGAVALMRASVEKNRLSERLFPALADLRGRGSGEHAAYDLVTCNPPYKPLGSGVYSSEDSDRIARHETMCTLEDVVSSAAYLLRFGGRLCLCQLPERLADILILMRRHAVEAKRVRFVQQRAGTAPWLVLVEGKRGAKPHLVTEPPLIIERERPGYGA